MKVILFLLQALLKTEMAHCQMVASQDQVEGDSLTTEAGQMMDEARALEERAWRLEEEAIRWVG